MVYTMLSVTNSIALHSLTLAFTTTCKELLVRTVSFSDHCVQTTPAFVTVTQVRGTPK